MTVALGLTTTIFLALSAAGWGSAALQLLGVRERLPQLERWPTNLTIGVGLLGWLMFFPAIAGFLTVPTFLGIGSIGVLCLLASVYWRTRRFVLDLSSIGALGAILLLLLFVTLDFDFIEALAPPADADSLAYHFALPKLYLAAGKVVFIPRAVDGAPPLLLHMTYTMALGLGGETAMTLWSTVIGWLPGWLVYAVSRRFVSPLWAATLALLFLETPAVIYSGAAGHVEVKLAAFALVSAAAAADCIRTGDNRFAVLAGLAAGFSAAGKYNGLVFAAVVGVAILLQRNWLRAGLVYGGAAFAAAWQWYGWDYANSGDPMFPLLYHWLGAKDDLWSAKIADYFATVNFSEDAPAPRNLLWLISYPFVATFNGWPIWDSSRTGLGPFCILALPFAIGGALWVRRRSLTHPLVIFALITAGFYAIWYFSGTSQRIRHLIPLYPLALVVLGACAARLQDRAVTRPLIVGTVLTLAIQLGGHAVFAANYIRHLAAGESREAFLERNVSRYAPVPWINSRLSKDDRILITERQLVYHIDVPTYTAQTRFQYLVDLLPGDSNPRRFASELDRLHITHILLFPSLADYRRGKRHIWTDDLGAYTSALVDAGCAEVVKTFQTVAMESRTLPALAEITISADIVKVDPLACRF